MSKLPELEKLSIHSKLLQSPEIILKYTSIVGEIVTLEYEFDEKEYQIAFDWVEQVYSLYCTSGKYPKYVEDSIVSITLA